MIVSFVLAIPKNDNNRNFENVAMKSTLNSCKINEGVFGNFIIKMAMDDFDETADFKFSVRFAVRFDGKLFHSKKIVNLFTFKVFGTIHA